MTHEMSDNKTDWNKLLENESERELQEALINSVKSSIETQDDEILQRVLRESLSSLDNSSHINTPVSSDDEDNEDENEDNLIIPIINRESDININNNLIENNNLIDNTNINNNLIDNSNNSINITNNFMYPVHPLCNYPWFLNEEHQALENSNYGLFPESILKDIGKNPDAMNALTCFLISKPDAREHEAIENNIVVPHSYIPHSEIYLPFQMFEQLKIDPGYFCDITYITEKIAIGTHINLMPMEKEFLQIKDQESLMLNGIINKYTCIRSNNIIRVFSEEINRVLSFRVLKTKPADIISLLDTDLEVEFKIPPAFLEPKPNDKTSIKSKSSHQHKDNSSHQHKDNSSYHRNINTNINNDNNDTNNQVSTIEEEVASPVETEEQARENREKARMARLAFFANNN